jgi:hypothetical protein
MRYIEDAFTAADTRTLQANDVCLYLTGKESGLRLGGIRASHGRELQHIYTKILSPNQSRFSKPGFRRET